MAPDYSFQIKLPAPPGYPEQTQPDRFSETCFAADYDQRRAAYFEALRKNPAQNNFKAAYHELGRLTCGDKPHLGILTGALTYINQRNDCADFVMHSILRILYQFHDHEALPGDFYTEAEAAVLDFKFWPDEPGIDSMCTWTENHYILFSAAAYLAGQLYPERIFTNSGHTGLDKKNIHRPRILRWLELRFQTGFSEWLSHVYYDEDLAALINLVEFCDDEEIVMKSKMVIDLILLDIALNSFGGVFASTHGRSYQAAKQDPYEEATTDVSKLLFGRGVFSGADNMSAVLFALSKKYEPPPILFRIANRRDQKQINKQRMGINVSEIERWGIDPANIEDRMVLLTQEAYLHPKMINGFLEMLDQFRWWQNQFFAPFLPYRGFLRLMKRMGLLKVLASYFERDLTRNTREEVNLYTYRTNRYQLSTAVDYRKGYGGDQQHIWQASLGGNAVCFTTHPAHLLNGTPNAWTGSGLLPRAAQYKNVAVVVYDLKKIPALYVPIRYFYTHAWLPKTAFDEVQERDQWVFARKGDAYLGLYSSNPTFWNQNGVSPLPGLQISQDPADFDKELIAPGNQQIWLCELGERESSGSFEHFMQSLLNAKMNILGLSVDYDSPQVGRIQFGWQNPLVVDGKEIKQSGFPRYENPYLTAAFGARSLEMKDEVGLLTLDFDRQVRFYDPVEK